MNTPSNVNIVCFTGPMWGEPPVTGGFPSQRQVTRIFDIFFVLRLNKRLSKQSRYRWFQTPSCLLWRQWNEHEYEAHGSVNNLQANSAPAESKVMECQRCHPFITSLTCHTTHYSYMISVVHLYDCIMWYIGYVDANIFKLLLPRRTKIRRSLSACNFLLTVRVVKLKHFGIS